MNIRDFQKKIKPFLFFHALSMGLFDRWSDETYSRFVYRLFMGKRLELDHPRTFNEKLQWLKLNDHDPEYTRMVDKYEAKKYAAEKIGAEYIIPTLGVWDSVDDIDFDALPERFVLKCTHDSGSIVICRDKSTLDIPAAKAKLGARLKRDYYLRMREWPYKNVKPRIIAEEYMEDAQSVNLPVYKFFCFDGRPVLIQAITNDKQPNESIDYFDTQWKLLELRQNFPNSPVPPARPERLEEMVALAAGASAGMRFIRVDLYCINGRIYFSEYTFYTDAGITKFYPPSWDEELGKLIKL